MNDWSTWLNADCFWNKFEVNWTDRSQCIYVKLHVHITQSASKYFDNTLYMVHIIIYPIYLQIQEKCLNRLYTVVYIENRCSDVENLPSPKTHTICRVQRNPLQASKKNALPTSKCLQKSTKSLILDDLIRLSKMFVQIGLPRSHAMQSKCQT